MSESTIERSGRPRRARALGAGLLLAAVAWTTTTALHAEAGTLGYDPASDPVRELQAAVEKAKTQNARILVVVGGEWCSWCHVLDRFVKGNDEIKSLWERNFVTLKVHFDPETPNEEFLGRYPEISGYPHIFVLDTDGAFLHSQNTGHLEEGDSYSTELLAAFLTQWAPAATPPN